MPDPISGGGPSAQPIDPSRVNKKLNEEMKVLSQLDNLLGEMMGKQGTIDKQSAKAYLDKAEKLLRDNEQLLGKDTVDAAIGKLEAAKKAVDNTSPLEAASKGLLDASQVISTHLSKEIQTLYQITDPITRGPSDAF